MIEPHPYLFSLQKILIKLSQVDRNRYLAGTNRRENDTEHSFSVAILCWFIHDYYSLNMNIAKILKYALVHDLVEVYAGDVNTFASDSLRKKKIKDEKEALDRLSYEFKDFEDIVAAMQAYEEKTDEESKFVWTVDKMQALILADLDNWKPYKEISVDYDQFVKTHTKQLEDSSKYTKNIFDGLLQYCKSTYYDRPKAQK